MFNLCFDLRFDLSKNVCFLMFSAVVGFCLQDEVLTGMQQKLDDLCQQLSLVKDLPGDGSNVSSDHDHDDDDDLQSKFKEKFRSENLKFVDCGCWLCDQHHPSSPAIQVCVCVFALAFTWR